MSLRVNEEVNETVENLGDEKPSSNEDVAADGNKDSPANEAEEKEAEDKEMALEEYEKVLEEKRKALQELKTEGRKLDAKGFESMQQLSSKKDNDDIFIKLGSDKDKCKEALEKEEKSKKVPGAAEASVLGDPSNLYALGLLAANKGVPMQAVVVQVRDGSTLSIYLLPNYQFVEVFVAGIQAPQMGRRATSESVVESELTADDTNGDASGEPRAPLTSAQRLAVSTSAETTSADPFAPKAKTFTEMRVLNCDVRIVLEGVDKFSNLIGSVHYPEGESAKDLALELVKNGLAKYVEWSANMMEEVAKRRLKTAELQAKKDKLKIWTNYVPPPSNSKAIHDQNFTVVEVVSGDCIIVVDDSISFGSPLAERRVNLSSIRCPKMGNPRRDGKPASYAREAKEFLRARLIGRQVNVQMEYSRKVAPTDGSAAPSGPTDSRVMDFGSIFLLSTTKADGDDAPSSVPPSGSQQNGMNVA